MILIRNEAQSPDIRSFQATVRKMLSNFIRQKNRSVTEKDQKLPIAYVNIVDIPMQKDIEEILKNVRKINWLKFRFFPLNNDLNTVPFAEDITKEMKKIECKHANAQFISPDSKSEVKALINQSAGLAVATLEIIDSNGNKTKIKENQFTSNRKIKITQNISPEHDNFIVEQAKKDLVITPVSSANSLLYETFKPVIEKLID
ncbi:hypothetical protein SDC9_87104 [bioreactor metagenome]|uniref:Uncharacterized protein n=1 Tax=bioreactor metagenome TaxID=1076179 RepID=A0A644ZHW0_9ZZZZ